MSDEREVRLRAITSRLDRRTDVVEPRFAISRPSEDWQWEWSAPAAREPYFTASVTKLFTAAITAQLIDEGRLGWDDRVVSYLGGDALLGLVVRSGVDLSAQVTVRHLLAHTSGIADYFVGPDKDGASLMESLRTEDPQWGPREAIARVRGVPVEFAPGTPGKALYSDTNYQLLQLIIEALEGATYAEVVQARLCEGLGLSATYVFSHASRHRFDEIAALGIGDQTLEIPGAMSSFGADGSVVSTLADQLTFIQAFMGRALFSSAALEQMTREWNRITWPLKYGAGLMLFSLPTIFAPLRPLPDLIGHSGATGSLLFYAPSHDLYIAGSVNQVAKRSLPFRVAARLANAVR